ncbi:MAG: ATP synthase subunit I [Desulfovibrionales bacterium]|nr:ATP synthase subunit I [Desulfovibrionales bacterium]
MTMYPKIEKWLYHRGFQVPEVRRLAANQICITMISILTMFFGAAGVDFFLGVFLGSINFLALAKVIQELVYLQKGAVGINLLSFYGRLIFTAIFFYVLIVIKEASVIALLLGVSTVLVNILLWGLVHCLGKTSKEA